MIRKLFSEICTFKQENTVQTGQVKQSNHFACNFAKGVPILLKSFSSKRNDNYSVVKQDHHTFNV